MSEQTDAIDVTVCEEIKAERVRQQREERWSHEHDDLHERGELADAAAFYASVRNIADLWPWDVDFIRKHPRRRQLVIAAALIVAEIERIDRAEKEHDDE